MKGFFGRVEAYGKLHWKELLALVLAAIPAFFLLFHKGTQQAAANAISYIPAAFAGDSGSATAGGPGGDPGTQLAPATGTTSSNPITAAVSAVANVISPKPASTSVNGANAVKSPAIPKTGFTASPGVPTALIAAKYPVKEPPAAAPVSSYFIQGRTIPKYTSPTVVPSQRFNPIAGRSSGTQAIG